MKPKIRRFLPIAIAIAFSHPASCATLHWDGTDTTANADGGAGAWNTTGTNWDDASTGGANASWPSVSTGDDDAVFGGTGGAVDVDSGGITANDISLNVTGYTIGGGTLTLGGTVNVITAAPNSNNVATISAPLAGTNGFTRAGSGTLTISGSNTGLSGAVTVNNVTGTNNGGLVFSGASSTGGVSMFNVNGSASPTADGGWLGLANGAAIGSTATVNLSGQGGNSAPPGTLRCTGGTGTVDGTVNLLTGNVRISSVGAGSQLVINGKITDGGNGYGVSFRFGEGTGVYLTNTGNTWTGDTVLGQGILRADPGALPPNIKLSIAGSGSGWLQTSGTLNRPLGTTSGGGVIDMGSNAANKVVGLAARGGNLSVNFGGAAADIIWGVTTGFNPAILGLNNSNADSQITLANPLDLNGAARVIQVDANTAVLQGALKNSSATAAALRKTGAGTLECNPGASTSSLAGLNTGGGTLRLKSGTYTISGSATTGTPDATTGFIVARGGTFQLSGASVTCTGGSFVFTAGNTSGGNNNFILDSGTFDGGAKEVLNAYGATGTTTINGGLFICGDFRISQSATGTVNLNGGTLRATRLKHNNNTEIVNFNGGTLQAKSSVADLITSAVDFVNIQAGGAVIDSNGFNVTIPKGLPEDATSTGGGLTKKGGGILELTGTNSYKGSTVVDAGTLLVNGDNSAATGAVSINNSSVLGGNGVVGGAITVGNSAKLAPGASAGTLTTSANVGGSGMLAMELDGAAADKLVLTGTGAINISGLALEISTLGGGATEPAYVIVNSSAPVTGAAFASVTGIPSGYTLVYNYNDGADSNNIALVAGVSDPFTSWAATQGLTGGDAAATADPDNDGLDNAIEFVLGGQPNPANPGADSSALVPTLATDAGNLIFTFRRTDLSMTQSGISILAEYGSGLTGWTAAVDGVNGVSVVATDDFYATGVDRVVVTIPKTLATGSKLFARLNVSIP